MRSMVYISGATGGLGRSMAVECASRGWDMLLTDLDAQQLESFSMTLSRVWDVQVDWIACDMASTGSRTDLIKSIQEKGIRLKMAIHVAGLDCEGPFLEKTREQILSVIHVNAVSTVDMMHSLTAFRDESQTYRVITVCSLAGMFPMPVKASYAATKSLLINISLALREEFKGIRATVTALCPAGMATNEAVMKSLDVQGIIGRITTLEVGAIAAKTVDAALKGRAIYIPGLLNRLLLALSRALPPTVIARLIGRRWTRTHKAFVGAPQ